MRDFKTLAMISALCGAFVACASTEGDDGTDDPPTSGPTCGDAVCAPAEIGVCQADCGSGMPNTEVCGNGKCEGNEPSTCIADCNAAQACGNGTCESSENMTTCPGDCTTGGGGTVDCNDQNVLLECFTCLLGAGCVSVSEADCLTCFGSP
jgi:hypothetical protein